MQYENSSQNGVDTGQKRGLSISRGDRSADARNGGVE